MDQILDYHTKEKLRDFLHYLLEQKNYSTNTLDAYQNDLNNFFEFTYKYLEQTITQDVIKQIDLRLIRAWLSQRYNDNYTPSSNARALSSLKSFYRYLEKRYKIKCHAIYVVKTPKKSQPLPKALSKSEASTALNNVGKLENIEWLNLRNKALLTLIYATGLRISEALSISKKDLYNEEFLTICGKGKKQRIIPWIAPVRKLLHLYINALPYQIEEDQPIFRGKRGGVLQRAVFNKELIGLRRSLGLPESLSSHAFRHSFATHLLENGANLRSIQDLLGHASLSTTQCYTKINHAHLKDVYNNAHPDQNNLKSTKNNKG